MKILPVSKQKSDIWQLYKPKHGMESKIFGHLLPFPLPPSKDFSIIFLVGQLFNQCSRKSALAFSPSLRCSLFVRNLVYH